MLPEMVDSIELSCINGLRSLAVHAGHSVQRRANLDFTVWVKRAAPSLLRLLLPTALHYKTEYEESLRLIDLPQLKGLWIAGEYLHSDFGDATVSALVEHTHGLEELSIPTFEPECTPNVVRLLKSSAPTLRRLHLAWTIAMYREDSWNQLCACLMDTLPLCIKLEVFQFEAHVSHETFSSLVTALPLSVRHVGVGRRDVLRGLHLDRPDMEDFAKEILKGDLPRLESVQLVNYAYHTAQDEPEFEERAQFQERGIALSFQGPWPERLTWSCS